MQQFNKSEVSITRAHSRVRFILRILQTQRGVILTYLIHMIYYRIQLYYINWLHDVYWIATPIPVTIVYNRLSVIDALLQVALTRPRSDEGVASSPLC